MPHLLAPTEATYITIMYNETSMNSTCLASGKPEVDFDWYLNGEVIDSNDPYYTFTKVYKEGNYSHCLKDGWEGFVHKNNKGI